MNAQNKILVIIIIICLSFNLKAQEQLSLKEKIETIEKLTEEFRKEYDVPAITIGLIIDGEEWFINQGHFDRNKVREVDENLIFQTASVSKIFAGIIINTLILEGKMKRSEPISTYLPTSYAPQTLTKLQSITVRDLLHHRSGLPGDSKILRKKRKGNEAFIYAYTAKDFESELSKMRLKNRPGEVYSYSNFGYALLGYLAENITGLSYEQLIKQYVRKTYGLQYSSTMVLDKSKLVTAYRKDKRHLVIEPWQMGELVPPSGIFSTASDLLKLAKYQLKAYKNTQNDPLILTKDSRLVHKESSVVYGYGLQYYEDSYWHGGEMDGFAGMYAISPKTDGAHVILSSCNGDELTRLSGKISQILYH